MKKSSLLLFALFLLALTGVDAQRNCQTMDYLEQQLQQDPGMAIRMQQIERRTQQFMQERQGARNYSVVTIPVVVHVVYNTSAENISDAQVQSQIDVLNEDFRRLNADANNVWPQASDVYVEFCLATVDPNGNPTNGINRKSTSKKSFGLSDQVKSAGSGGVNAWPADDYLNMWVCDLTSGYLGYAQFPGGNPATDGVVIDYLYFGRDGSAQAPFDLGRTATHEVGHWLNLRHIWGDGGCSYDDFVTDTPTSDAANYGCATGHVSCGSVDMVQNYMDYSDDACMNLFTAGQTDRMQALFSPGGARYALSQSTTCGGGGGGPTCSDGVQNGNETGVDCGGSCPACPPTPTCNDGIQNGNETGVDCGGSCPACPAPLCAAATNLHSTPQQNGRRAVLSWDAAAGALSYTVQLRRAGTSSWASAQTTSTSLTATGLTRNRTYEWRVTSNCAGGLTATTSIHTFVSGQSARNAAAGLVVYPNPVDQWLTVDLGTLPADMETTETLSLGEESKAADLYLLVYDLTGRLVHRSVISEEQATAQIDAGSLAKGLYLLKVQDASGALLDSAKFMVER